MSKIRFIIIVLVFFTVVSNAYSQTIKSLNIRGNHTTDSSIIIRELSFSVGDSIAHDSWPEAISNAEENLMNTSLFVFVEITWSEQTDGMDVTVHVKERWYYWIYPILEHADRNLSAFFHNADWKKINYGLSFEKHNLFGRNQFLKLKARFGYREQMGILYENPGIDNANIHGFQVYADRFMQRQVAVMDINDKPEYFYHPDLTVLYEDRAGFVYIARPAIHHRLRFFGEYHRYEISDSLYDVYPVFLYNAEQESDFIKLALQYEWDERDDRFFPTQGFLVLSEIQNQQPAMDFQKRPFLTSKIQLHFYHAFTERMHYAFETNGLWKMTNTSRLPYHLSGIMGYDYYPRGFEYHTIHGTGLININQTLRYKLFSREKVNIPFIPVNAFDELYYDVYLYAFWDNAKTWYDKNYGTENELPGGFLTSTGAGIECHTYYDRSFGCHVAFTNHNAFGIFVWFYSPLYKIY
ncbi:MAG: BamA/TamA family outer membrane protein [Bacteroidota bacterium]|nr:BamA/TamA family outer membrane protein [Bacteroidota bacterium]